MKAYEGYMLDLDGTVYRGKEPIPEAIAFIHQLKEAGLPYLFITNNSSATPEEVSRKLQAFNVPAEPAQVWTTALAAAAYVKAGPAPHTAYIIGETGLLQAMEEAGVEYTEENPTYVVMGIDRGITYEKLAKAALAVRNGAVFISTNSDKALPTERGFLPGNGALTSVVQTASGKDPVFIGKPERVIIEQALYILGTPLEKTVLIGDNYDTDILAGIRSGMDTIHVQTGITSLREIQQKAALPSYSIQSMADWKLTQNPEEKSDKK